MKPMGMAGWMQLGDVEASAICIKCGHPDLSHLYGNWRTKGKRFRSSCRRCIRTKGPCRRKIQHPGRRLKDV